MHVDGSRRRYWNRSTHVDRYTTDATHGLMGVCLVQSWDGDEALTPPGVVCQLCHLSVRFRRLLELEC